MTAPLSTDTQAEWEFRNGVWRLIAGNADEPPPPVTVGPAPTFFDSDVARSNAAAVTNITWPAGHAAGDIGILVVETSAQNLGNNPPAGWAHVGVSPIMLGTPGTAGAIGLNVLWKRATSGAEPQVDIGDSGDHQIARLFVYRGCVASGVPYESVQTQNLGAASTGVSVPGLTTQGDNRHVIQIVGYGTDTTVAQSSGWANADLTSFGLRSDTPGTPGFGGGFALASGIRASAGVVGAASSVLATASTQCRFAFALLPTNSTGGGGGGGGNPPPPGSAPLRYGPYGQFTGLTGAGPRGLQSDVPYFGVTGTNPHTEGQSAMNAMIDIANTKDIIIVCRISNSPATYGSDTTAGFNMTQFKAQLDKLVSWTKLSDALNAGRCWAYFSDEPYHQQHWGNSWSPTLVNQCARECKIRWPGCMTILRCDGHRIRFGWNGQSVPTWDAVDYGVLQYEGPEAHDGDTLAAAWLADKADAAAVNVGCLVTINIAACGVQVANISGFDPCWNTSGGSGGSGAADYGVLMGAVVNATYGDSPGKFFSCSAFNTLPSDRKKTFVGEPAWVKKMGDDLMAMAQIGDVPMVGFWPWADGVASWFVPLQQRADFIAAQNYLINLFASRASATGFRTPKVYP